jgi:hypothetical protein
MSRRRSTTGLSLPRPTPAPKSRAERAQARRSPGPVSAPSRGKGLNRRVSPLPQNDVIALPSPPVGSAAWAQSKFDQDKPDG